MTQTNLQIRTEYVTSIATYLSAVISVAEDWLTRWREKCADQDGLLEIWYRGNSAVHHQLTPSAYRKTGEYVSAFNRFINSAPAYMSEGDRPKSEWEWYYAAQHFGLPTRLLDWTESATVGLHFAMLKHLNRVEADVRTTSDDDLPTVWMMEAATLNEIVHGENQIYVTSGKWVDRWLPITEEISPSDNEEECFPSGPIALLPAWANRRIVAQMGRFTVHGCDKTPIDELFTTGKPDPSDRFLARIVIRDTVRVAREMRLLGFAEYHLFPEAAYLANHLRSIS